MENESWINNKNDVFIKEEIEAKKHAKYKFKYLEVCKNLNEFKQQFNEVNNVVTEMKGDIINIEFYELCHNPIKIMESIILFIDKNISSETNETKIKLLEKKRMSCVNKLKKLKEKSLLENKVIIDIAIKNIIDKIDPDGNSRELYDNDSLESPSDIIKSLEKSVSNEDFKRIEYPNTQIPGLIGDSGQTGGFILLEAFNYWLYEPEPDKLENMFDPPTVKEVIRDIIVPIGKKILEVGQEGIKRKKKIEGEFNDVNFSNKFKRIMIHFILPLILIIASYILFQIPLENAFKYLFSFIELILSQFLGAAVKQYLPMLENFIVPLGVNQVITYPAKLLLKNIDKRLPTDLQDHQQVADIAIGMGNPTNYTGILKFVKSVVMSCVTSVALGTVGNIWGNIVNIVGPNINPDFALESKYTFDNNAANVSEEEEKIGSIVSKQQYNLFREEMMKKLNILVEPIIQKYVNKEKYKDAIDKKIKYLSDLWHKQLLNKGFSNDDEFSNWYNRRGYLLLIKQWTYFFQIINDENFILKNIVYPAEVLN